jgi:hypothetical protein
VQALVAAIDELAALDLSTLPDALLGEQLVELSRQIERLQAQQARFVEAFDRRGAAQADGHPSTAAWLRRHTHLTPSAARSKVLLARALADKLPHTAAAFRAGAMSLQHAQVIARGIRRMPDEHLDLVDQVLAKAAESCDPAELERALVDLRHQLEPEAVVKDERDAFERRELHASTTIDGMVAISAMLDPEAGAQFLTLLSALTKRPDPAEPLTKGQRQADAFAQIVHLAQSADGVPNVRGERPVILVRVDFDTLQDRLGAHAAQQSWTGPVSGEAARRMACDAGISRIIVRGDSQILDLGRTTRCVTPDQFRALVVRDGGCRFDGCGRPPDWCIAHHLLHWALGGPTDIWNLILLCRYHHHAVHEGGWIITLNPDNTVTCRPPGAVAA